MKKAADCYELETFEGAKAKSLPRALGFRVSRVSLGFHSRP